MIAEDLKIEICIITYFLVLYLQMEIQRHFTVTWRPLVADGLWSGVTDSRITVPLPVGPTRFNRFLTGRQVENHSNFYDPFISFFSDTPKFEIIR